MIFENVCAVFVIHFKILLCVRTLKLLRPTYLWKYDIKAWHDLSNVHNKFKKLLIVSIMKSFIVFFSYLLKFLLFIFIKVLLLSFFFFFNCLEFLVFASSQNHQNVMFERFD